MKLFQSSIEKLLYVLILLIFVVASYGTWAAVNDANKISDSQGLIIKNQVANNQAIKVYINCLTHIDPKGDVQAQLNSCFNAAPKVKG